MLALVLSSLALAGPTYTAGIFGGAVLNGPEHELYWAGYSEHKTLGAGLAGGVRLGIHPVPALGLEGAAWSGGASVKDASSASLTALRLQLIVRPKDLLGEGLTPLLVVGAGNRSIMSAADSLGADVDWAAHVGPGVVKDLGDGFAVRADLRAVLGPRLGLATSPSTTVEAFVGVELAFPRQAPEPVIVEVPAEPLPAEPIVLTVLDAHGNTVSTELVSEADGEMTVKLMLMTGTVTVSATDPDGKPVEVVVHARAGDREVTLDEEGPGVLEQGNWTLVITAPGLASQRKDVTIVADEELKIAVEMRSAQVQVAEERIEINTKILFDSGSFEVHADSFGLLDEVANTLLAHSNIRLLEVGGHTDDEGKDDFNLELSQKRVDEVVRLLVDRGVDAKRLKAVGYGETKPLQEGEDAAAREANRRVELNILERDE